MIYFELFFSFMKIGLFTFGGGYAMLPMLTRIAVNQKRWITEEEMNDLYALGQLTPGIIAVNTATFVGIKKKGLLGGIVATLGMIFPSIIIITLIAIFSKNFSENETVSKALNGVRIAVCALVTRAVYKLVKASISKTTKVKKALLLLTFGAAFATTGVLKISPVFIIVGFLIIAIITSLINAKGGAKTRL